ncbi:hypothetical protein [Streptomyces sp. CRN 30]|uniref:hypothetical protein n=1 Tax=Streptomyces sp. CRN 30 TaxID=3075613 RepID=UPI002A82BBE1|nr:hypothetical protein [Streptomyces sp. CRN 30]
MATSFLSSRSGTPCTVFSSAFPVPTESDVPVGRASGPAAAGPTTSGSSCTPTPSSPPFPASATVVRGRALGFDTRLTLHGDLARDADTAVLGFDELTVGLPPLVVLTYLYRHVTPKIADGLVLQL